MTPPLLCQRIDNFQPDKGTLCSLQNRELPPPQNGVTYLAHRSSSLSGLFSNVIHKHATVLLFIQRSCRPLRHSGYKADPLFTGGDKPKCGFI